MPRIPPNKKRRSWPRDGGLGASEDPIQNSRKPLNVLSTRVQIHLNLANPERAENVIRVQNHRGTWVGVAYATEVVLGDAAPVIDEQAQRRISQGEGKKTPHAFLEGELLHFRGRLRDKAPESLKKVIQDHLASSKKETWTSTTLRPGEGVILEGRRD